MITKKILSQRVKYVTYYYQEKKNTFSMTKCLKAYHYINSKKKANNKDKIVIKSIYTFKTKLFSILCKRNPIGLLIISPVAKGLNRFVLILHSNNFKMSS